MTQKKGNHIQNEAAGSTEGFKWGSQKINHKRRDAKSCNYHLAAPAANLSNPPIAAP